ncbi:UNVERIFIED_CONTAM: hypothetical protein Sradi_4425300 [Sesamum radiatum]|uniref:Uncharacterized protein n=1 Tax=Sesamum radiatum TaxID=300843 RepID=A0AAW2NSP8_SESRA
MAEGSSIHDHCVQMLSFVEKVENLKAGIKNDTYIDVFLQSFPPSYDPFIVNFNMNELEKFILELINLLVQFEATIKRSEPTVILGKASTFKKRKKAQCWKKKKSNAKGPLLVSKPVVKVPAVGKGKKKKVPKASKVEDACHYCYEKGQWKRNCPKFLASIQYIFVDEINIVANSGSWILDTDCGAHICNDLQVMARSRRLSKREVDQWLGNHKRVAAEAVGLVHLVVSDHARIDLK